MKTIQTRLLSFGLIASLGFLLLVSLAATSVVEGLGDRLKAMLPDVTVVVFYIINLVLTLGVTTILFAVIFKVLPDARIKWKDIWPGAIATSLLFLIGKFAISLYVSKSDIGSTYGAAGSLAVILVWIYYSAIILYFGAEFTKSYAFNKGAKITPNHYAQWSNEPTVPNAEPKQQPKNSPSPSDSTERHYPHYAPQLAVINPPVVQSLRPEKKKGPGMGTILFGLAVYYMDRAANKKRGGE
jgi:membrane protein